MKRKLICLFLTVLFTLAICPFASAEDIVGIDKVNIETYPTAKATYNDLPTVGQQVSGFHASTITPGISVAGCSLVDDDGVTCTGIVENKNYTLYIDVVSNASNYIFTGNTKAFINGISANISINGDGTGATVSRYIKPNIVDPVIYKNPTDENHDKSTPFSFTASASPVYTSFQWYIMTTYGEKFTPEELSSAYPGVTTSVKDMGTSGVRLNIGNPLDDMSGWLVYCTFTGYSGVPVATSKATMTIKGAKATETTATPIIVDTEGESSKSTTEDGVDVPEGITIVETPTPSIEIVETPSPSIVIVETPTPTVNDEDSQMETTSAQASTKDNSKLFSILKWVGIVVGAVVIIALVVLFIPYLVEKKKNERRRKMSGRNRRK